MIKKKKKAALHINFFHLNKQAFSTVNCNTEVHLAILQQEELSKSAGSHSYYSRYNYVVQDWKAIKKYNKVQKCPLPFRTFHGFDKGLCNCSSSTALIESDALKLTYLTITRNFRSSIHRSFEFF